MASRMRDLPPHLCSCNASEYVLPIAAIKSPRPSYNDLARCTCNTYSHQYHRLINLGFLSLHQTRFCQTSRNAANCNRISAFGKHGHRISSSYFLCRQFRRRNSYPHSVDTRTTLNVQQSCVLHRPHVTFSVSGNICLAFLQADPAITHPVIRLSLAWQAFHLSLIA